jgi:acyl transferase domain-containing protein
MNFEKQTVFMFSGQGSQHLGMAKDLYYENTEYRDIVNEVNEVIFCNTGISVINELYINKNRLLLENDVVFSSMALCMVQYSMAKLLINNNIIPEAVIGTSLGEFISYAVSGVISLEDMVLYLSKTLGNLQCLVPKSGMITVLGNAYDDYLNDPEICTVGSIGAINYDGHFMLSGLESEISQIKNYYASKKISSFVLPVNVGFHNNKILSTFRYNALYNMQGLKLGNPEYRCISCVKADEVYSVSYDLLYDILCYPILFQKSLSCFDTDREINFLDVGPMGTLAGFVLKNNYLGKWKTESLLTMSNNKLNGYIREKCNKN